MIHLKSDKEIAAMREGGQILAKILQTVKNYCQAGMTTADLNKKAEALFEQYNVIASFKDYNGFPGSICTAINNEVVHGIPNQQKIKDGDIVTIDCGVYLKQLHTDSAITFGVGEISADAKRLLTETTNALHQGISMVKPGNRIGDISFAIEQHLKKHNITPIPDLIGHGIGKELHEPPQVPNTGKRNKGPSLKPGMTFAIEPITCLGSKRIETLEDNWTIVTADDSLACQQEHTVLVTTTGVEILTELK